MEDFRLGDLESLHLEKVIKKLDYRSYYRLQQTCRDIKQFIRDNKNISIHMDGCYELKFEWNSFLNIRELYCYKKFPEIKIHDLYATRLELVALPDQILDFEQLCDYLDMNRVTCEQLQLYGTRLSKEQLVTVLNSLKPSNIYVDSKDSDRFEAVFQSKTLKSVKIELSSENVSEAAPRLLSAFAEVDLQVSHMSNPFTLLRSIVQMLFSQSVPNLRKLQYFVSDTDNMTTTGLEEALRDFNIPVERPWSRVGLTTAYSTLPGGYFCKINLQEKNMELYYEEGDLNTGRASPYSSVSDSDSDSRSSFFIDDDDLADLAADEGDDFQQLYIGGRF